METLPDRIVLHTIDGAGMPPEQARAHIKAMRDLLYKQGEPVSMGGISVEVLPNGGLRLNGPMTYLLLPPEHLEELRAIINQAIQTRSNWHPENPDAVAAEPGAYAPNVRDPGAKQAEDYGRARKAFDAARRQGWEWHR